MKQIKDNTNICKDIPCSWIRIINIAKITILYKAICIFKLIPIKLPKAFFTELESNVFYLYGNRKDPKYPKNPEKEKWSWRNQAPWLQSTLKDTVIKTAWYWHKIRNVDQWKLTESQEINTQTNSQVIYDKEVKNVQWRKDSLFNKWYWKNWTTIFKRTKSEHSLKPHTQNKHKIE